MKMIIIDDQIDSWNSAIRWLKTKSHVVYQASTLRLAEIELGDSEFDLVICDGTLEKPGDGAEFARKLHQAGQKVILCSGQNWEVDDSLPQMPKPVYINELEAKIQELLHTD